MKFFLVFFILFLSIKVFPQSKKTDSLLAVNDNYTKEDSLKVVYLTNIFRQYNRVNDFNKVEEYAGKAIALAKKLQQTVSLTKVYEVLGLCYHGKAKYLQAIEAYNNGIAIAKKRNDKAVMAGFYIDLAALYGNIPDYDKSLDANQRAIALANETGDKESISNCYMNIGAVYYQLNKPVEAVEYMQKALTIFKTQDNGLNYGVCVAYSGISDCYLIASDADLLKLGIKPAQKYQLCLDYLNKALNVAETAANAKSMVGPVNSSIGIIYEKLGNHTQALSHFQLAYEMISKQDNNKSDLANILYTLGDYYYSNNDFAKSKNYLHQCLQLAKETGLLFVQESTLQKLSAAFEKTNRFDSTFFFYRQYIEIKDSIFNQEKEKEITRKQLQIDFAVKENDYKLTQQVTDGKLKQQELQISYDKKIKWFLAIAIALVLIIAGLILYDQRKTKRLNKIIGEQKASLEQLGQVKDKLFSVVSHDMRAPVNSLLSFIDILDDGKIAPEKLTVYAKDLKENLSHTSALMNNLLNWAASQMQGFKPVNESFDVSAKVTGVVTTLQHQLQQKQVTVQNNIPANTIINADRNMTAAILRNLISNAIKYSYKEDIINISAENTAGGCTLSVKDEGTGMDITQAAAFNNNDLHQTESKRGTDNEKGTGLGLLLCKTFAEQMGGKILAVNDDKGMTFKVWLPGKV
jgi:signal transduction histidine kinase